MLFLGRDGGISYRIAPFPTNGKGLVFYEKPPCARSGEDCKNMEQATRYCRVVYEATVPDEVLTDEGIFNYDDLDDPNVFL